MSGHASRADDGPAQTAPAPGEADFPRAAVLVKLLRACRGLSNVLEPRELYAALAGILAEAFGVQALSIFLVTAEQAGFEWVFSSDPAVRDLRISIENPEFRQQLLLGQPLAATEFIRGLSDQSDHQVQACQRLGAVLWLPLVMRQEMIGLLAIGPRGDDRPFEDADAYFLSELASHAAVCIRTGRVYAQRQREKEDLDKTLQNLSLLYNIGKAINYISDLKKLLQYILSQAIEITSAEKGSNMLYDMETDRLNIRVLAGLADVAYQEKVNNNEVQCRSFRPGEGIAGRVFLTARPIVVNNIQADELFVGSETSFARSIACIPMVVYSEPIGVINVTNKRQSEGFTEEDVNMLKAVADQAAVAVNKAQLWDMAVTDSLTGLYVRRYFMMKLQEEIHRAERYKKVLSVIMADLDHFKSVNDTYGHSAGDRVLQAVCRYMRKNIRDVDILARYGGEEFVFLLPDADKEAAVCLSERLRRGLAELRMDDLPTPSLSLGVASYPADSVRLEDLIQQADAALYAAKQAGRNRTVRYSRHIQTLRSINRSDAA
ncbi:MAG: diguanylate cyclase [Hyphomicrobiales bacterium]